jgi:primosomal protein N' (replication factor Y)
MEEQKEPLYVDVILPLALPDLFTYGVPGHLAEKVFPGQRVVVQFGKQKVYAALVAEVHSKAPTAYQVKQVLEIVDDAPVITPAQLKFWKWIADYYLCTLGEVMAAALPSALRLQSETKIVRNPLQEVDTSLFTDREYLVYEALELKPELTILEISKILSIKHVMPVIRSLIAHRAILVQEEMAEKYKPRYIDLVTLHPDYLADSKMGELMDKLEKRAPKQLDIILNYLRLTRELDQSTISKSYLLKNANSPASAFQQLVKKEIFVVSQQQTDRLPVYDGPLVPAKTLNPFQVQALHEIQLAFAEDKVTLLHGVTSSGKTEVYVHLMEEVLAEGKQVLYLLPEIALTTQVITRLQRHFGNKLLVYHSRFNEQERVEVWNKVLDDNLFPKGEGGKIIIGARSSLFLPVAKLGLVIVDEEHDASYKQEDPAPRYNARDGAIVLAHQQDAQVLLGTATPGLESYYNALTGKYALVTLDRRHAEMEMPEVFTVDMREARKRKQVKGNFSNVLIDQIESAIKDRQQVILFQNRRGFAPFLECGNCSWVPLCVNCDVALTYHKSKQELRCHYCGYMINPPVKCGACGDHDIKMKGFGTERIEEDLQLLLPDAKIARLDYDTTRSKTGFSRILQSFEEGDIDILVGTQMVTKGLDFDKVNLVGILNADSLLHFPDFRSFERGFQLLSQVSGRAGRKYEKGKVIIQTFDPLNVVLQHVLQHDYKGFYDRELIERHKFSYPPYFRLIEIRLKHRDEKILDKTAMEFVKSLQQVFGKRVLGPTMPTVTRVRNLFLRNVLIKLEKTLSVGDVKKKLNTAIDQFKAQPDNRQLIIQIDVDPM